MKSLSLLECLVKTGCEKCAEQCKKNICATLSTIQFMDKDAKDMGNVFREKAENLVVIFSRSPNRSLNYCKLSNALAFQKNRGRKLLKKKESISQGFQKRRNWVTFSAR